MPEISIIVPVYNVEKYLDQCVKSILNQIFSDFELILVDDGSPDNCPEICDRYAEQDARVRVIHQSNAGVSAARNAGLDIATGSYIMFCDSDDYVEPNWCAHMVGLVKSYPNHGIICNAWEEQPDGIRIKNKANVSDLSEIIPNVSYFELYKKGVTGSSCLEIFDRNIICTNGMLFEEGRPIGEDALFCTQYLMHCSGLVFSTFPLYHYVNNAFSAMHQYYPNLLELTLPLYEKRLPLLDPKDIPEFSDIYFYIFMQLLDECFDKRNTHGIWHQMSYNQKMMKSDQFRKCVNQMSGKNENPLVCRIAKKQNYYLYFIFQKLCKLKNKIFCII